jgi:hypothetical protein
MRLFFAGDMPEEQTTKMIEAYCDKCRGALQEMAVVPDNIAHWKEQMGTDKHSKYWELVALFGKTFFEASEQWAAKTLTLLKKEKELTKNENSHPRFTRRDLCRSASQ